MPQLYQQQHHFEPIIRWYQPIGGSNAARDGQKNDQTGHRNLGHGNHESVGQLRDVQKNIEKAGLNAGAASANWDVDKDLLTVAFEPSRTNMPFKKQLRRQAMTMKGTRHPTKPTTHCTAVVIMIGQVLRAAQNPAKRVPSNSLA